VLLAVNKGLASGAVLYTDSTHLEGQCQTRNKFDLAEVQVKPQEYLASLEAAISEEPCGAWQEAAEAFPDRTGRRRNQGEPHRSGLRLHGARW